MNRTLLGRIGLLSLVTVLNACNVVPPGNDGDNTPQPSPDALADFTLADVNTASERFGEPISPREYLGTVSAWYFGAAT